MEDKNFHKELDLIQDIIKRMASNSFLVKGWCITVFTVLLTINKDTLINTYWLNVVLIIMVILFWYLDAFFLKTEKNYRRLYSYVIENREVEDRTKYDLRIKSDLKQETIFRILVNKTLLPFYLMQILILTTMMLFAA